MGTCDMCGKEGPVVTALVEGTEMTACKGCGKFGKVVHRPAERMKKKAPAKKVELVEVVVDDYAKRIRHAREASGKTQKEFALALNEKESVVQKLETGGLIPPMALAKKLERLLKIKLIEVETEAAVKTSKNSSGPLTIGDLLKVKK